MKFKFFDQVKKDIKNKKKTKQSFYFLFLFIIFFLIIYFILTKSSLYYYINYFFGITSNWLLNNIYFVSSSVSFDLQNFVSVLDVKSLDYPVIITLMCTGILEFALLASAILSTINVSIKKRMVGFFTSIGVVVLFNLFRIVITTVIIVNLNLQVANFFHGFLFRLFLVIIVLGTYWIWLKRSSK